MGDGACFVQGQPLQVFALLQIHAAFDQNAFSRRRRQTADDADRGGNHQGARAGNHQHHQGTVEPIQPRAAHEQRRQYRHQQGNGKYDGGVPFRELVDKALCGCAAALGRFHRSNDARQSRITGSSADLVFKRACFVNRACKHRIAYGFFHGQTLARDGSLVDAGAAFAEHTIQCQTLARLHAHGATHGHGTGQYLLPSAIGL